MTKDTIRESTEESVHHLILSHFQELEALLIQYHFADNAVVLSALKTVFQKRISKTDLNKIKI